MAVINAFSPDRLHSCGFTVLRREDAPVKIRIEQVNVVRQNLFAKLENAKHLNAEFVDFEDQAWILSKEQKKYTLFGRIQGDFVTINHQDGMIYSHSNHGDKFVNASLLQFICCFGYLQSIVINYRSKIIANDYLTENEDQNLIAIFGETDATTDAGLRLLLGKIDPVALAGDTFWASIVSGLEAELLSYNISPSYYFVNGRFLPSS